MIEHSCSADYQICSIGCNLLLTSAESFKVRRSLACAGKTTLKSSDWRSQPLLPPSRIEGISRLTGTNAVFPTRVQNLRFLASSIFFKALEDVK